MRESDLPSEASLVAPSQDSVPRADFPTAEEDGVLMSRSEFLEDECSLSVSRLAADTEFEVSLSTRLETFMLAEGRFLPQP